MDFWKKAWDSLVTKLELPLFVFSLFFDFSQVWKHSKRLHKLQPHAFPSFSTNLSVFFEDGVMGIILM